jgi:UMP-CMP kinase
VLFFECAEDVCKERCLSRGAAGSGRDDDNPETLHKRFETYNNDTMPMVEFLEKEGLLRRIDANRTVDEIFADVEKLFTEEPTSEAAE